MSKTYTRGTSVSFNCGKKEIETHELELMKDPPKTYSEAFKWLNENKDKMTDKEVMSWIGTLGKLWKLKG